MYSSLVAEKQRIMDYASEQTQEIKEYFYGKFDEVDDILAAKASELRSATTSKAAAEAALKQATKVLSDLENVKNELEAILEI